MTLSEVSTELEDALILKDLLCRFMAMSGMYPKNSLSLLLAYMENPYRIANEDHEVAFLAATAIYLRKCLED